MKPSFLNKSIFCAAAVLVASITANAQIITNGGFEASPNFTGWTNSGATINTTTPLIGLQSANLDSTDHLTQGFTGITDDLFLDYVFRINQTAANDTNRFRIRDTAGNTFISLRLNFDGDGVGTSSFDAFRSLAPNANTWQPLLSNLTLNDDTLYYFRLTGSNLDDVTSSGAGDGRFTLGFSTDGVSFTTSALSTDFHVSISFNGSLGQVRWEGGSFNQTIDGVSLAAIPEPSSTALLLSGLVGAAILYSRRRCSPAA